MELLQDSYDEIYRLFEVIRTRISLQSLSWISGQLTPGDCISSPLEAHKSHQVWKRETARLSRSGIDSMWKSMACLAWYPRVRLLRCRCWIWYTGKFIYVFGGSVGRRCLSLLLPPKPSHPQKQQTVSSIQKALQKYKNLCNPPFALMTQGIRGS